MAEKQSLPEKYSQSPIFEFEGFVLRPFDGWNLWFENPQGEGTTIGKAVFLGWLIKLFKEHF